MNTWTAYHGTTDQPAHPDDTIRNRHGIRAKFARITRPPSATYAAKIAVTQYNPHTDRDEEREYYAAAWTIQVRAEPADLRNNPRD